VIQGRQIANFAKFALGPCLAPSRFASAGTRRLSERSNITASLAASLPKRTPLVGLLQQSVISPSSRCDSPTGLLPYLTTRDAAPGLSPSECARPRLTAANARWSAPGCSSSPRPLAWGPTLLQCPYDVAACHIPTVRAVAVDTRNSLWLVCASLTAPSTSSSASSVCKASSSWRFDLHSLRHRAHRQLGALAGGRRDRQDRDEDQDRIANTDHKVHRRIGDTLSMKSANSVCAQKPSLWQAAPHTTPPRLPRKGRYHI